MAKKPEPLLTNDQRVKAFIKLLNEHGHSRSARERFHDWCELAYCAVAKTTATTVERADELEARYMSVVAKYRRDEGELRFIRESAPEMMAIAFMAVSAGGVDFLGDVAAQLEVLNAGAGQFFTPFEVSRFMAKINVDGLDDVIAQDGYVTVGEPAAGAGGMILAWADEFERAGYNIGTQMLVQAVDVSALAYYMCFLQLSWRGVPAGVIRGNTLSLETFESAWTVAAATTFLEHHGHLSFSKPERTGAPATPEIVVEREPVVAVDPEPELDMPLVQLSFFD